MSRRRPSKQLDKTSGIGQGEMERRYGHCGYQVGLGFRGRALKLNQHMEDMGSPCPGDLLSKICLGLQLSGRALGCRV